MDINASNIKLFVRGMLNPIIFKLFKREYDTTETILISGVNRSGTTWLAELLATIPNTGILFEPMHEQNVQQAKEAGFLTRNYHSSDENWPEGKEYLYKVLSGKVLTSWTTAHLQTTKLSAIDRWIVKDININPMLGWIINNFDTAPPVVLIRHPCAILASIIKRGWERSLSMYVQADQKFRILYPQYEPIFQRLTTVEEVFAVRWCIDYLLPLKLPKPYPFELVSYERLVMDGPDSLSPIFGRLGVGVPEKLEEVFDRPSLKSSTSFTKDKRHMLSKWRDHLSVEQVEKILAVVRDFGLDFYTNDPEPDYERLLGGRPLDSR